MNIDTANTTSVAALPSAAPTLLLFARVNRREKAAGTPLLPRERIGADFIERAIADDDEPAPQLPATAQSSGPGLMGAAKQLLRGLGFGT